MCYLIFNSSCPLCRSTHLSQSCEPLEAAPEARGVAACGHHGGSCFAAVLILACADREFAAEGCPFAVSDCLGTHVQSAINED